MAAVSPSGAIARVRAAFHEPQTPVYHYVQLVVWVLIAVSVAL